MSFHNSSFAFSSFVVLNFGYGFCLFCSKFAYHHHHHWCCCKSFFGLKQVVIEIPYVFVQTLVYTLITYAMLFFEWTATKFLWYFYCVFCLIIGFAYYGMMMVALTANEQLATIAATFFYSVFNLYAGFMIPLPVGTLLLTHDQGFFFCFFSSFWPQKYFKLSIPQKIAIFFKFTIV